MIEGLGGDKAHQVWAAAKVYVENLAEKDAEEAAREAMARDFFSQKAEREAADGAEISDGSEDNV